MSIAELIECCYWFTTLIDSASLISKYTRGDRDLGIYCDDYRLDELTDRQRVTAACSKIRTQFPDNPEAKLSFSVVSQAIKDAYCPNHGCKELDITNARDFLQSEMLVATISGVEPEWIRLVLRKIGLMRWTD